MLFFFFKQKTAYEMRISDWSSDVCSSDLVEPAQVLAQQVQHVAGRRAHAGASSSRSATARRCASRPSALASITAHGPIAASPSGAAACTLIAIWKLATDSPPTARAAPPVGSTWLVPLQSAPRASDRKSKRLNSSTSFAYRL